IVISASPQSDMLNIIHESHLSIEKMKSHARSALFWPIINSDIEQTKRSCATCAKHCP
ncbi:hypothetical protein CAPTEDRAFT_30604, partial [Capitella teleta]